MSQINPLALRKNSFFRDLYSPEMTPRISRIMFEERNDSAAIYLTNLLLYS